MATPPPATAWTEPRPAVDYVMSVNGIRPGSTQVLARKLVRDLVVAGILVLVTSFSTVIQNAPSSEAIT